MGKKQKPNFFSRAKAAAKYTFIGYDGGKDTRYRAKKSTTVRSEELELGHFDRDRIISTALDFRRNNPVVSSISRLRKADVVGRGIIPQADTGDDDLNREIESRWMDFSAAPEASGQMDMREMQQQMSDALLYYGDCGLIMGDQQVQFVDGSRIGNPTGNSTASEASKYQNGVEIDDNGRPIDYWTGRRVNGVLRDLDPTPAEDFFHFFRRVAPVQYRGIPELAPVINTLQDVDEYDKVEMIAAKVSASLSVVVKRDQADQFEMMSRLSSEEQDEEGNLEAFEPGRFHYMNPGEDVSVIGSNGRPNVDGIQWVSYLLRKVGSAVGIPLEFLLMEIGGSSFSASQGVVLQYQQTVESYQSDLIRVLNRLYRRWLVQLMAAREIDPGDARVFNVRWQRPAFRWINRAAQVKADMEYFRAGAMSLDDITAPFGYTAEDVLTRKAQNIKRAKEIAEANGIEDWRELINPFQTSISGNYNEVVGGDNPE